MVKIKLIILTLVLFLLALPIVFSGTYGACRYGLGQYGIGEDCGASGGASSGGDGGGGSGGSSTSSTSESNTILTLEVPNDIGDGMESSLRLECVTGPCSVTANEIDETVLPSNARPYVDEGGELIGVVQLKCNSGDLGSNTATISIDLGEEDLECNDLRAAKVHDDGTVSSAEFESCSINNGKVAADVSYSGCSYLVIWSVKEEVQPTVSPLEGGEQQAAEEGAGQALAAPPAVGSRKTGLVYLLLAVVVILVAGYLIFKKKRMQ